MNEDERDPASGAAPDDAPARARSGPAPPPPPFPPPRFPPPEGAPAPLPPPSRRGLLRPGHRGPFEPPAGGPFGSPPGGPSPFPSTAAPANGRPPADENPLARWPIADDPLPRPSAEDPPAAEDPLQRRAAAGDQPSALRRGGDPLSGPLAAEDALPRRAAEEGPPPVRPAGQDPLPRRPRTDDRSSGRVAAEDALPRSAGQDPPARRVAGPAGEAAPPRGGAGEDSLRRAAADDQLPGRAGDEDPSSRRVAAEDALPRPAAGEGPLPPRPAGQDPLQRRQRVAAPDPPPSSQRPDASGPPRNGDRSAGPPVEAAASPRSGDRAGPPIAAPPSNGDRAGGGWGPPPPPTTAPPARAQPSNGDRPRSAFEQPDRAGQSPAQGGPGPYGAEPAALGAPPPPFGPPPSPYPSQGSARGQDGRQGPSPFARPGAGTGVDDWPAFTPPPPAPPDRRTTEQPDQEPARRRFSRLSPIVVTALVTGLIAGGIGGAIGVAYERDNHQGGTATSTGGSQPAALSTGAPTPSDCGSGSIAGIAAAVLPSVVTITVQATGEEATGSGVIVRPDGYVLTNNHVVAAAGDSGSVMVQLFKGLRNYRATIVGRDPKTDLAVIRLNGVPKLPAATLGQSRSLVVGAPVVAIGAPLGYASTVTSGIVSGLDRDVDVPAETGGTTQLVGAIQTDAAINPGNSGGALVDCRGQVIGINSAIATVRTQRTSNQSGSIGVGFAIPVDYARSVAQEIIRTGHATHPYLGVTATTISPSEAPTSGGTAGAFISDIALGGPADSAGLRRGDIITAIDGRSVAGGDDLITVTRLHKIGETVTLTYVRNGQVAKAQVKLVESPD